MSHPEGESRPVIAVAQYSPIQRNTAANRAIANGWIELAAARGAALIVLPECCLTGLIFGARQELFELAEDVDGPTVMGWLLAARERSVHVCGGLALRRGRELINAAVFVSPSGRICVYAKTHLFGQERTLFSAGDRLVCVDLPWGRVGLATCYDLWFPEVIRQLALAGASLVISPANWFAPPRQASEPSGLMPMAVYHATSAACSNEVTIACASRTGVEAGVRFLGHSAIIGPNGRMLAGPAGPSEDVCLMAPWPDPSETRSLVQSHLATRRPAVYDRWPEIVQLS